MVSTIDHLIVAATTLEEGAQFVQKALGVAPQPGGKHERMGTHNCLLKLGPELYLEIIAIDPEGKTPSQPRWFDLDSPGMRAELQAGPRPNPISSSALAGHRINPPALFDISPE